VVIVVRAPHPKLLFLFTLSVLMVAGSAWLAWAVRPFTTIIGLVGVLFFGLCGGWILARLFSNRVSLLLDRVGLIDNSSALPAGRIEWDQISRVGITTIEKQRFLGIDVKDRTILASSSSAFRRWVDETNLALVGFPVNVPSTTIDRPLEDLEAAILRYWKHPETRTELGDP
jgi:hypothetical protein